MLLRARTKLGEHGLDRPVPPPVTGQRRFSRDTNVRMERNTLHQVTLRVSVTRPPGSLAPDQWDWPSVVGEIPGLVGVEQIDHIAIPAKRCANETCGRWFTLQEGRAEKGQHKKVGVMYCTSKCARAQAQRDYRRRRVPA